MAKKKKQLTEREIVSLLDQHLTRANDRGFSALSDERRETLEYYEGVLPKVNNKRSQYVSPEVYDAVESVKAVVLNAMSQGHGSAEFVAEDLTDERMARVATAYCNHVFYKLNDGQRVLHDALHTGLLARNAVAKVWWEPKIETEEYEITGTEDAIALMMAEQNENTLELPADVSFLVNPETGEARGIMEKQVDKGQVRVEVLPPEEFLICPEARTIQDASFIAHRSNRRISELVEEGYDEDRLKEAGGSDDLSWDAERIARNRATGGSGVFTNDAPDEYDQGEVQVEECYIRANLDGTKSKRWKITKVGSYVLEQEVADAILFVSFCALPVAHSFWGNNFASRLKHTQNASTTLTRSILDQTVISSYPRWMVVKGGVKNPAELTDLRFGGLVNVENANSVAMLPQPQVNQYVMTTLDLIATNRESISGVSRTAMGLNHDVVGKQNSGALLDQVTAASQQKVTQIAAQHVRFLADVYLAIYDLALRYERKEVIVEVAGTFVAVDAEQWRERRHVSTNVTLNPNHKAMEAQKLAGAIQLFGQDPVLASMMGPEQKRYAADRYLRLMALPPADKLLLPVDQIPEPQPDPNIQQQQQLLQAQQQANALQQQAAIAKQQAQLQIAQLQAQVKAMRNDQDGKIAAQKVELAQAEMELKAAAFDHDVEMDKANLGLAKANGLVSAAVNLQSRN